MIFQWVRGRNFGYSIEVSLTNGKSSLSLFFLIFGTLLPFENGVAMGGGTPGCFELIVNRPLTSVEVSRLPMDCQEMRKDYFELIDSLSKDRKNTVRRMKGELERASGARTPYSLVLFSMLMGEPDLQKALSKRAFIEKKLKVPYRYADAALLRAKGGECLREGRKFAHEFYREICTVRDSTLNQLGKGARHS
jgi:hypothetical protein